MSQKERWIEALKAKGHTPKLEEGDLDIFFFSYDTHNGPGCAVCGWSTCWHCDDIDVIPECREDHREVQS